MIEVIYRGACASNVYQDANNTLAQLVAAAKRNGDYVYLRTPLMTVLVQDGSVSQANDSN